MRWRPSIFMPRDLSRITLEVTSVRVERLQAITEEDAKAEGVQRRDILGVETYETATSYVSSARAAFEELWDDINGERASWASNPWCWCVSFRRLP